MKIGDYEFTGPFDSIDALRSVPGLFAIVYAGDTGTRVLMEVEYSENIRKAVESLVTNPSWQERAKGGQLRYGVRYTNDSCEEELRLVFKKQPIPRGLHFVVPDVQ